MDRVNKATRSRIMSSIHSKWTKLERDFNRPGLIPHMKVEGIEVDFVDKKRKITYFLDSCFWHGCSKHYREPKSNVKFWKNKIEKNMRRDRRQTRILRKCGWNVIRIWSHSLVKKGK